MKVLVFLDDCGNLDVRKLSLKAFTALQDNRSDEWEQIQERILDRLIAKNVEGFVLGGDYNAMYEKINACDNDEDAIMYLSLIGRCRGFYSVMEVN